MARERPSAGARPDPEREPVRRRPPAAETARRTVGSAPARRIRRGRRRALLVVGSFLGVVALVVVAVGGYFLLRFHQIHKVRVRHLVAASAGQPVNILLIGDNSRCVLNGKQASAFGSCAAVGGGRSDVTIVLHLDPRTKSAALLSLPRDTWQPIPGTNRAWRIDDNLDHGPSALVLAVEDDFGIPINHYIELNFDTFQNVVKALGGLDMYFPEPMYDPYSGLKVGAAGCYTLTPFQTLALVRARHLHYEVNGRWYYDGLGDLSRIQRDHEFLRVLADQVRSRGLTSPLTLNRVLGVVSKDLTIDSGFGVRELASLILAFRHLQPSRIPTETLPIKIDNTPFVYRNANYGLVVFPTEPYDLAVIHQIFGLAVPATEPGTTVAVRNGSGLSGQATGVAGSLRALGYDVTSVGNAGSVASAPPWTETIVYYSPGHQAQAEALLNHVTGLATMGERALPAGEDLELVTGSVLSISAATAVAPTTSHGQTTHGQTSRSTSPTSTGSSSGSGGSSGAANTGSASASYGSLGYVFSSGGKVPYYSWEPRACPAGMPARSDPYNRTGT